MNEFQVTNLAAETGALLPYLVVACGGLLVMLFDAFVRTLKKDHLSYLTILVLSVAVLLQFIGEKSDGPLLSGMLLANDFTRFFNFVFAAIGETTKEHDLILVVGSSVFPYYPYMPGAFLGESSKLVQITSDPDEASRAPMGEAIVADVKLTLAALNAELDGTDRPEIEPWPAPTRLEETDPLSGSVVMNILGDVLPEDAVIVLEAPTSTMALRNQLRISKPNSYFFGAGGGLGFGLSSAVGIGYAEDRPVICVLGEGSVQYAVTAFWTAAAYDIPVTFLILRNEEYGILKWFAEVEQVTGAPGLDLPALETAKIAEGYGIESRTAANAGEVEAALKEAIADPKPRLVEVPVQPGMAVF